MYHLEHNRNKMIQNRLLYPSAFKLLGIIPNVALILENSFNCRDISNSHLKATVGIYQKVAKSKQSGIHVDYG